MAKSLSEILKAAKEFLPEKMFREIEGIAKQDDKKEPVYGEVQKGFKTGVAEGGVHGHSLVRNLLKTLIDGRHRHIFVVRTISGELIVLSTDLDGPHGHGMDSPSDKKTLAGLSEHQHVVRIEFEIDLENGETLKPGMIFITELGGEHEHGADMLESTNFDGAHPHTLKLPGGMEIESIDITEFWEIFGPFEFDDVSPIATSDQIIDRFSHPPIVRVAKAMSAYEDEDLPDWKKVLAASMGAEVVAKAKDERVFKQEDVQEVILSKKQFKTVREAMSKLRELNYPNVSADDIEDQPTVFRARIAAPSAFDRDSLKEMRLATGVRVKVGNRKGKVSKEAVTKQTQIQSLIFDKKSFKDAESAKKWAKDNNFSASKVDETGPSFRLRQKEPDDFRRLRTIDLKPGIKATVGPLKESVSKEAFDRVAPSCDQVLICKQDEEQRIVTGIVLEPDVVDDEGDVITEEEIDKAAAFFIQKSRTIGFRHRKKLLQVKVVGSMVTPAAMTVNGPNGKQRVKKGTWLLSVHIPDDTTWELVKTKQLNAFSVGGFGAREPLK